jgi:predicted phosphodiesterase
MKIALLSDIHGNLPALQTCLDAARALNCERLFCLGDTFGYFQDGVACFEMLQQSGAEMMMGNHEAMLLGILVATPERELMYRLDHERQRLSPQMRRSIQSLLPYRIVTIRERRLLMVHGAPWDPLRGYVYPDADLSAIGGLPYDFVFMGHTHRPFIRAENGVCVTNVGSCGLPRDVGDKACFAVYDTDSARVDLIRPPLDGACIRARYKDAHEAVLQVLERR